MTIYRGSVTPEGGSYPKGDAVNILVEDVDENFISDDVEAVLAEIAESYTSASDLTDHIDDTSTHGVAGDLVGNSDTQTLTNKSIDLANNTLTGTLSEFNSALSDGSFASLAGTETLTNKSIDLANNTLTGTLSEFNSALSDGSFASLTGTEAFTNKSINLANNTLTGTLSEFNSALSDGSFASLTGTETLTNKALTSPDIDGGTLDNCIIGGTTPAEGSFTTFTSTGIDDNSSGERLEIRDASVRLGVAGSNYGLYKADDTAALLISSGAGITQGAGISLYGENSTIRASDFRLRINGDDAIHWDESAGSFTFSTGTGSKTDAFIIDDDDTTGNSRILVFDVDDSTLKRVSFGSDDSGGTGYKVLRVPN